MKSKKRERKHKKAIRLLIKLLLEWLTILYLLKEILIDWIATLAPDGTVLTCTTANHF